MIIAALFFVLALIYFWISMACRPLACLFFLIFGLVYVQVILTADFTNFSYIYYHFIHPLKLNISDNGVFWIGLLYYILICAGFAFLYIGATKLKSQHWKVVALFSVVTLIATGFSWIMSPPLNIVRTFKDGEEKRADLPSVLYIIFDEHGSLKWMPESMREAESAKEKARAFYEEYGFLLFESAHSHYYWSEESISNALNFTSLAGTNSVKRKKTKEIGNKYILTKNKVFDHLSGLGYKLRAYYSDYLDLCSPGDKNMEYCYEYKSNSSGYIKNTPIPVVHKSAIIFEQFLRSNIYGAKFLYFVKRISYTYFRKNLSNVPIIGKPYYRTGPLSSVDAIKQLKEDIARYPRGTVFLAHFLTPHHPFMFDSENNLKRDPRSWVSIYYVYWNQIRPSKRVQYQAYYEQMQGLYKYLDGWFSEMDSDGTLKDLKVVFHGDHGSRICRGEPTIDMIDDDDWAEIEKNIFTTIFAVKDPQISQGTTNISKPVEMLLSQYLFEPASLSFPDDTRDFIYVQHSLSNRNKYNKINADF